MEAKWSQSPVLPRARLAYEACLNAGSTAEVFILPCRPENGLQFCRRRKIMRHTQNKNIADMKPEIIRAGQIEIKFMLEAADTNGSVAMFEFTVPVGARVPAPHSHAHYDETLYGVTGALTLTAGGKTFDLGPGESYFIPRGEVHGFINAKSTDTKALAVITPALLGPDYFREIAAIANAGGPPDLER